MARYQLVEGKASKFWEITRSGRELTTRWGRIGSAGQAKTKSFASEDAARKEHDQLVAEKTAKGYVAAGEAAPAAGAPVEDAAPAGRWDVWVYNEATAFILTSRALAGGGFGASDAKWARAVAKRQLFPFQLAQDNPFILRVVVGGELTGAEASEWVGRVELALELGDPLVVAGGSEYVEEGEEFAKDYSRVVPVPAGSYRGALMTYLPGLNGEACLREAGGDPKALEAWWKKTRGRKRAPAWIRDEEEPDVEHVQFLLHLTPLVGAPPAVPPLEDGLVSAAVGARRPPECPVGLVAENVQGKPTTPAPPPIVPLDVEPLVRASAPSPLAQPLVVPLANLERLFMLSYLANGAAHPSLTVQLPRGAEFNPEWPKLDGAAVLRDGDRLHIRIPKTHERWAGLWLVRDFGPVLAGLPDGSVLELCIANPGAAQEQRDPRAGLARHRGTVTGGRVKVTESFPAVPAGTLAAALALVQALEGGDVLPIDDDAQGLAVLDLIRSNYGRLFRASIVESRGREARLIGPDEGRLRVAAVFVFRLRFGDTWPVVIKDGPDTAPRGVVDRERKRFVGDQVPPEPAALILSGQSATFARADITAGGIAHEALADIDAQLAAAGFTPLGDLTCSKLHGVVLRAYAHRSGSMHGSLSAGPGRPPAFDVVSAFENQARATTTTRATATTDVRRKIFGFAHPELALGQTAGAAAQLVEAHARAVETLAREQGQLRPAPTDLTSYARSFDDALVLWGL